MLSGWSEWSGLSGRDAPEQVVGLDRTGWSGSPEYAVVAQNNQGCKNSHVFPFCVAYSSKQLANRSAGHFRMIEEGLCATSIYQTHYVIHSGLKIFSAVLGYRV